MIHNTAPLLASADDLIIYKGVYVEIITEETLNLVFLIKNFYILSKPSEKATS